MTVRKGKQFERETAALADEGSGKYGKRVYKSGAIGTTDGIDKLVGDARWVFPWLDGDIISIECKHGYGDDQKGKSFRIQREWFDKHLEQCKAANTHPMFAMKFKFTAENGLSKFMLIPFPVMQWLIKNMENMHLELEELRHEQKKRKQGNSK